MSKLTLTDVSDFRNGLVTATVINNNSAAIEQALENTLSRDGTSPNQMGADLDMDSHDLINVGDIETDSITMNGVTITDFSGFQGPEGPEGPVGPAGPSGGPGEQGEQGPEGPPGDPLLDGVYGDITVSGGSTLFNINAGAVGDAEIAAGIDAAKIGTGVVSNTEFGYLDGVTSAIQTQIDGKQPLDSDLTSWATVTRASGFDTFATTPSSTNLRALLTDEVGTGSAYFIGGALGTPASGTLTNATGLPISTGVSGLGTGVATFLATPTSANLASAITNETGSGALVFATSPTLVTPNIGAATATSINFGGSTLSTYATGSWTPNLSFGGGTTGLTYLNRSGSYVRIGNLVFAWGFLVLSAKGSSTGSSIISGLPFTVNASSNFPANFSLWGPLTTTTSLHGSAGGSTTSISIYTTGTTATAVTDTSFQNTTSLTFSLFYLV